MPCVGRERARTIGQEIPRPGPTESEPGPAARAGIAVRVLRILLVMAGMGVSAALGGYLVLVLTVRGREVLVPDLGNMTREEAETEAKTRDLTIELTGTRLEPRVAEGRVIEQSPRAGASTRPGRAVKIVLSQGAGSIVVPSLEGTPLRKAQVTLEQAGLRLGSIAYAPSVDQPTDDVLAQSPPAGARRQKGDAVDLLISRGTPGRTYVMPDLAGVPLTKAEAMFEDYGIRVGVTRRSAPEHPSGTIIDQKPAQGSPLREREAVQLVVAR